MNNQIFSPYSPEPFMRCPNDDAHKHFITGAVVCQDWLVDGSGNFVEVADDLSLIHISEPTRPY